ncbi:MAG: hypothetical protein AAF587_20135 [Bacteroidota bacterium]
MHNLQRTILLFIFSLGILLGYSQTLQVGGKIGGTTVLPSDPATGIVQPGGTAGMFADYKARRYRMGVRLEMNYQNRSPLEGEQLTLPALAKVGLDRQGLVSVHVGPYVGVNPEEKGALHKNKLKVKWGFMTGLDLNIPLTRKMILISEARVSQDLSGNPPTPKGGHYLPAKSLQLSISFGLAYRIKHWREKRKGEASK